MVKPRRRQSAEAARRRALERAHVPGRLTARRLLLEHLPRGVRLRQLEVRGRDRRQPHQAPLDSDRQRLALREVVPHDRATAPVHQLRVGAVAQHRTRHEHRVDRDRLRQRPERASGEHRQVGVRQRRDAALPGQDDRENQRDEPLDVADVPRPETHPRRREEREHPATDRDGRTTIGRDLQVERVRRHRSRPVRRAAERPGRARRRAPAAAAVERPSSRPSRRRRAGPASA